MTKHKIKCFLLYDAPDFSFYTSVGILISGIGAMAENRKSDLIEVSGKALVGATLASCFTGLIAGLFV